jgi:cytochrome oxidase Cu insertion factor (SCO1/SenC/PrrC family)
MCLLLGGLGALLAAQTRSSTPVAPARFTPPRKQAYDFKLRDQDGRMTSLRSARGKVIVLTFLYTSCRDLCPAQAAQIVDAVGRVGGRGVMVYGVSVDPVGDTRAHVRYWLQQHGLTEAPVKYLTGTRAELAPVWRAYGIAPIGATPEEATDEWREYAEHQQEKEGEPEPYRPPVRPAPDAAKEEYPDAGDLTFRGRARHVAGTDYEHSAYVLLIDPDGEQRVGFPFEQLDPALLAKDIRLLRRDG